MLPNEAQWCEEETHEDLEYPAGLFVDEAGDTLDSATTRETADSGLGDTPERNECQLLGRGVIYGRSMGLLDVVS